MPIHFFSEQISFNFSGKRIIKKWIKEVAKSEEKELGTLNFIFCTDDYLLKLNREHLNHDTYTDIITFDYSEKGERGKGEGEKGKGKREKGKGEGERGKGNLQNFKTCGEPVEPSSKLVVSLSNHLQINGDLFISIDRVKENAVKFNKTFYNELHRVIIHGTLHLMGYKDKAERDKKEMREKEDEYLALLSRSLSA